MEDAWISVRFTYRPDDFVDSYLLRRRQAGLVCRYALALTAVAGLAVAVLVPESMAPGLLVAALSAFVFFLNANRAAIRWQLRGAMGPWLNTECEIQVSDAGVRVLQDGTTTETAWRVITGVLESRQYLILLRRGGMAAGLPRRAFASEAELDAFREHVTSHRGGRTW